jgi:hypothetical protein
MRESLKIDFILLTSFISLFNDVNKTTQRIYG